MMFKSLSFLLFAITFFHVDADSSRQLDKTPWKPIKKARVNKNARQYNPSGYGYAPSQSQAYSGPQQSMMARPVTYVPPQVTFNPPQLVYGNPSVTRAVSAPAPSHYRQQVGMPTPNYANPAYFASASQAQPSYAAPIQPYEYHLVTKTTPPPVLPVRQFTYQYTPQSSATPGPSPPQQIQFQLITQPSSMATARSYASAPPQYQLVQQASVDVPQALPPPNPYTITTPAPTTSTTPAPQTTAEPTGSQAQNPDNATFVDVVTVMAKYVRATGTQLSEMFTQLSNNTELNNWGYNAWTTSTTTTTTTPAPPVQQAPIVVPMVYPIMMPAAQVPLPPQTYAMPPPPPPPPVYVPQPSYSMPQQMYSMPPPSYQPPPPSYQLQPSHSQLQPSFAPPPPMYLQPPAMHSQPLPAYPQGKSVNSNEIMDNSIDHDYYYDCDKK